VAQCLFAKGFQLAAINKVSPSSTAGVILRESLRMGGWTGIENNIYSVPDRIWRTLIADRDSEGQIPPRWYQRVCLRCLEIADTFNNGNLNIGQLLQEDSEMLRIYLTRVRNITWGRKFFTSEKGDLFGLCPTATRQGDLVCILFGCSVPVILREYERERVTQFDSGLLGLDWTGSRLKSSPLRFYRDLAPGAPYNPYTIYSKSWHPLVLQ